jgi:hypothetical protein
MHDYPPREDLSRELRRVLDLLRRYLAKQRRAGRTPASDPLRGLAIEEGDAEELVSELAADLGRSLSFQSAPAVDVRHELDQQNRDAGESSIGRAARLFRLNALERDALALAIAVELDRRFARLVAYLNDHISRTRPTVGLLLAITATDINAVELCQGLAVHQGLLVLEGDGPLSGLAIRVAPEMLANLVMRQSTPRLEPGVQLLGADGPRIDQLAIGRVHRDALQRWGAAVQARLDPPPLVLAGRDGSGRATAARAASSAMGRSLVKVTWDPVRADQLGVAAREAVWQAATLLVHIASGTRESDLAGLWTAVGSWQLPVVLTVPPELIEAICSMAPIEPAVITLEPPTIGQREALWRRLLASDADAISVVLSDAELTQLAARFDFLPGQLTRAVRRAIADLDLGGSGAPLELEVLTRACRAVGAASMGSIAQRLPQPFTRDDLVLPRELMDELDLASTWIRTRRRVFEDWGFGGRISLGRGLTALFSGEPGTGKTMAAQVLAAELGLDLFRVDLSRVMSKYIGETEKNLAQLFDDAGASGAILFFDEADALFGKRSEVKDAHDRYANLEIGYLLQRMEEHPGTTVLATNRIGDLDEAFTRRFHFILDFPMPQAPERRRIWEGMLPRDAERERDIDMDALARDYEVSGGEIRNSVLSAAFIAAGEEAPIGLRHLKRGLRRELLKTGRVLDRQQRLALQGT